MNLSDKFTIIIPPQDISCSDDCLERLAFGDREAYAWVYKNYCKKVYDYAMLITNNKQFSEDLVQEVFMRLWMHREKLTIVENFNGYLYTLYRNLLFNTIKKQKMEMTVRAEYSLNNEAFANTANEIINYKELNQFIENSISGLPKQQKIVFRLSKEKGWKRDKIARELNVSPYTVKNHLQKAMDKLKRSACINKN